MNHVLKREFEYLIARAKRLNQPKLERQLLQKKSQYFPEDEEQDS